jgi:hypothetical protein
VSWHPFETSEATFDEAIQETLQTDPAVCRLGGPHAAGAIGAVFKMVDRMGPAALAVCGFAVLNQSEKPQSLSEVSTEVHERNCFSTLCIFVGPGDKSYHYFEVGMKLAFLMKNPKLQEILINAYVQLHCKTGLKRKLFFHVRHRDFTMMPPPLEC